MRTLLVVAVVLLGLRWARRRLDWWAFKREAGQRAEAALRARRLRNATTDWEAVSPLPVEGSSASGAPSAPEPHREFLRLVKIAEARNGGIPTSREHRGSRA